MGKPHRCDVCDKLFGNYSVMVVHKRAHFGERPYKCVDCGDRFNCVSSLTTQYKIQKQQYLNTYGSEVSANHFPSTQYYVENKELSFKEN